MNAKQKRFCEEYIIDCNATQAAIRAGYSKSTSVNASRWLDPGSTEKYNPELADYIKELLDKIEDEKIAKADEILKYLTSVMRGESEAHEVVVEGQGDGISEARVIVKPPNERERTKAAELLGKRYSLFTDNVNMDSRVVITIEGEDEIRD